VRMSQVFASCLVGLRQSLARLLIRANMVRMSQVFASCLVGLRQSLARLLIRANMVRMSQVFASCLVGLRRSLARSMASVEQRWRALYRMQVLVLYGPVLLGYAASCQLPGGRRQEAGVAYCHPSPITHHPSPITHHPSPNARSPSAARRGPSGPSVSRAAAKRSATASAAPGPEVMASSRMDRRPISALIAAGA